MSLLGFAGAVVRGKSKDVNIQTLESGNAELRSQIEDKERTISACEIKLQAASSAAKSAEIARKLAADLAQSRPAFEQLGEQMVRQHKQLLGAIGKQTTQMSKQTNEMAKIVALLTKGRI